MGVSVKDSFLKILLIFHKVGGKPLKRLHSFFDVVHRVELVCEIA